MINDTFRKLYTTIPFAIHFNSGQHDTTLHNHIDFEIILIKEGASTISIGDKSYKVSKDDIILINPFEVHSVQMDKSMPYSHICACFDCDMLIDKKTAKKLKNEQLFINHFISSDKSFSKKLRTLFENAVTAYNSDSSCSDVEVISYISLFFATIINNNQTKEHIKQSKNAIFCSKTLSYIAENYKYNISSKDAATSLSYNQSYFCRHFQKNFGQSFSEYLNMYRVSTSKQFLEQTNYTVTQIAGLCGFTSHSYFSKCFKEILGISPSDYQKTFKKTKSPSA